MRTVLAVAAFVAALVVDLRRAPARLVHDAQPEIGPWRVIENTGKATWFCYPTRASCRRFAERPGTSFNCVEYPRAGRH